MDHFAHSYWLHQGLEALKEDTRKLGRVQRKRQASQRRTLEEVESDVAMLSMLVRTLIRVMVEKDVCTQAEFTDLLQVIDGIDEAQDGGLDPEILAADLGIDRPEIDRTRKFVEELRARRKRKRRQDRD